MKIGFVGAQSTGKTETVKAMKQLEFFKDFTVLESPARRLAEKGLLVDGKTTPKQQLDMTAEKCAMDLETAGTDCISDRTPLDFIAHTCTLFEDNRETYPWKGVLEDNSYWPKTNSLVTEALKTYDYIFYFPIYWNVVPDGVRSVDENYRRRVDEMMKIQAVLFGAKDGLRHIEVPNVSPGERALWIQAIIYFPTVMSWLDANL